MAPERDDLLGMIATAFAMTGVKHGVPRLQTSTLRLTLASRFAMHSRESSRFKAPLAQRVAEDADSRQIADAIGAMWSDIESALQPVLGRHGVAALFKRVLHVTATSYPWLAPAQAGDTAGSLTELTARLAAQPPGIVMEAGSALFMTFRELLSTLIGTKLCERLLQAAWSTPSSAPPAQDPTP